MPTGKHSSGEHPSTSREERARAIGTSAPAVALRHLLAADPSSTPAPVTKQSSRSRKQQPSSVGSGLST